MEFSRLIPVSKSLIANVPDSPFVVSVHGSLLSVRCLPEVTLLGEHVVVDSPSFLACGKCDPHVIAVASETAVTVVLISRSWETGNVEFQSATASMANLPIAGVLISDFNIIIIHAHSLGISVLPVHSLKLCRPPSAKDIVFLPFISPARMSTKFVELPDTITTSSCGRFLAYGVKLPTMPGVRIMDLNSRDVAAEALGCPALGGSISEVCGIRWVTDPYPCLFVWGCPRDGRDAFCTLGLDCELLSSGQSLCDHVGISAEDDLDSQREYSEYDLSADRLDAGIKSAAVSATASCIALGMCNGDVVVINVASWRVVAKWNLSKPTVQEKFPPAVLLEREKLVAPRREGVQHEVSENHQAVGNTATHAREKVPRHAQAKSKNAIERASYFEVVEGLGRIRMIRNNTEQKIYASDLLQCGVSVVKFSADGKWLCALSDSNANAVFIFDVIHVRLAFVLILRDDVKSMSWSTQMAADDAGTEQDVEGGDAPFLAVVTVGESVYMWTVAGVTAVGVPRDLPFEHEDLNSTLRQNNNSATRKCARYTAFRARKVIWTPGDAAAIVVDPRFSGSFCVMYMPMRS